MQPYIKHGWRSESATHVETRRIKDTVIFDNRMKRHFVKDKATLAVYVHVNNNDTSFVNRS